ncbi:MAG TPA: hypothetical protein VK862_21415, partial [Afifellaceae bacterium]|nr:hypothetical protein [Afifellaceae bacterium]
PGTEGAPAAAHSDAQPGGPSAESASGNTDGDPANPLDANRIGHDPALLPDPVRKTWQSLVDAARSGDIEALRPLIAAQPEPPVFTFGEIDDPIDHLKSLSGDPEGREILAILLEVLEIGYVRVAQGTENEMYIWPYFADIPLERLTPEQIVELFTILTAGDYQDMLSYGAYIFFRVGISPDGRWHFFVAGD